MLEQQGWSLNLPFSTNHQGLFIQQKCLECKVIGGWLSQTTEGPNCIPQGVKTLFNPIFLAKSYFVLFFGKCPILSYFLAILPLILVFYSFLSPLFHARTILKKIFCLASLSIKIFFVHIMLEPPFFFFYPFHCLMPYEVGHQMSS